MMEFWLFIAVLILVAIMFIVWPLLKSGYLTRADKESAQNFQAARKQANILLYREHVAELEADTNIDSVQFQQLKEELELSLLDDSDDLRQPVITESVRYRGGLLVLIPLIPAVAIWLYLLLGASQDWQIAQFTEHKYREDVGAMHKNLPARKDLSFELKLMLEKRLNADPTNVQNWYLLATTHMELAEYSAAVDAYREVMDREDGGGNIMGEYVQALYSAAGHKMTPEVKAIIDHTLELNPHDVTALRLAGMGAYEGGLLREAISYWLRAVQTMALDDPEAMALRTGIAQVQAQINKLDQ
ncbi:MAG: c-type cytochrome biogenesis protein CcmI [Porticoccus sp.]